MDQHSFSRNRKDPMFDQLQEERTISDLLAAALVGEYDAQTALRRYCNTLASPLDSAMILEKYRLRKTE